jgi:hypothetical protein
VFLLLLLVAVVLLVVLLLLILLHFLWGNVSSSSVHEHETNLPTTTHAMATDHKPFPSNTLGVALTVKKKFATKGEA